jgi:hypothetical protein
VFTLLTAVSNIVVATDSARSCRAWIFFSFFLSRAASHDSAVGDARVFRALGVAWCGIAIPPARLLHFS